MPNTLDSACYFRALGLSRIVAVLIGMELGSKFDSTMLWVIVHKQAMLDPFVGKAL